MIFLKGFDFLSCISQRHVHRNCRTLKLDWILGAILSRLAAILTGETGVQGGAEAAGCESRDPQLGVLSASVGFVTPVGPKFSERHLKVDTGLTFDICLLISSSSFHLCKFDREGQVNEGSVWRMSTQTGGKPNAGCDLGPSSKHSGPLCLTFKRQLLILTRVGILLELRACVPCSSIPRGWTVIICAHDNVSPIQECQFI